MGRDWVLLGTIAFVLAGCTVFGASYVAGEGWAALPLWAECVLTIAATGAFAIALWGIDRLCGKVLHAQCAQKSATSKSAPAGSLVDTPSESPASVPAEGASRERFQRLDALSPRKQVLVTAAIILICWLPWLIANLPGSTYWDTYWQMWQVYPEAHPVPLIQWSAVQDQTLTDAWLVDHHPVLTTLIYGAATWLSDQFTGTWMAGVFVLSTTQTVVYALLFAWLMQELRDWNTPRWARIAVLAWVCLLPPVPTWAACVVKDSFFGMFFLPWFIYLANVVRTNGTIMTDRRTAFIMMVCALMMCLTKKTGIFIVAATMIFGCIRYRKEQKTLHAFALQGGLCLVVMSILLPFLVFPTANIAPGGAQEMLGTAFQQTARYAQEHELTDEEATVIDEVVDVNRVRHFYDADFQDSVKYYYHPDATAEELLAYAHVYIEQGLQDPEAYFGAVMALAGRYVAPTTYVNIRMVTVDTKIGDDQRAVLWNPEPLDGLRSALDEGYRTIACIPVLNLPFLTVTYVLWLPACALYALMRRSHERAPEGYRPEQSRHFGILFVPLAVMIAFCVIAPVFDARYAWGLLLSAPVLFALIFCDVSA